MNQSQSNQLTIRFFRLHGVAERMEMQTMSSDLLPPRSLQSF
jgi:hypothetical protein